MKTISKSEAANRWGIKPSMVTKYIAKGMPVTQTGRLVWPEVERWRKANIDPARSGSYQARQRKSGKESEFNIPSLDLESLLNLESNEDRDRQAYRRLLDCILSHRHLVPFILADLGVRDAALLHCADDLFCGLILQFCGVWDEVYPVTVHGDGIPTVNVDYQTLAARYGLEFTPEIVEAADRFIDGSYDVIERAKEANENQSE